MRLVNDGGLSMLQPAPRLMQFSYDGKLIKDKKPIDSVAGGSTATGKLLWRINEINKQTTDFSALWRCTLDFY